MAGAPWALRGLRDGVVTSRWPARPDEYFTGFPGAVQVRSAAVAGVEGADLVEVADRCPTGAILTTGGSVRVDRGRCVLCGRCVRERPDLFGWRPGADVSALTRAELIDPGLPDTEQELAAVRAALAGRVRALRRSVHIRHVDTGSDGSDEWEVQALTNPVYDIHRLGVFFTASPRHADILLLTGVGTAGMVPALHRTREAMPEPVVTIVAGTDAISGGLFRDGYTASHGAAAQLPVDVFVPGSPASPFSLLHGILRALDRLPAPPRERPR